MSRVSEHGADGEERVGFEAVVVVVVEAFALSIDLCVVYDGLMVNRCAGRPVAHGSRFESSCRNGTRLRHSDGDLYAGERTEGRVNRTSMSRT